jgi:hypothetical protein
MQYATQHRPERAQGTLRSILKKSYTKAICFAGPWLVINPASDVFAAEPALLLNHATGTVTADPIGFILPVVLTS